jgi:hypothetical protein
MTLKLAPLILLLLGGPAILPVCAQENNDLPLNQIILTAIKTMPSGGGYSAGNSATLALRNAVRISGGTLQIDASHAMPSYCSGATYLVFLKTAAALQASHRLTLSPAALEALRPQGQPDGTGIWGRWNANGPGTARLFAELGLGESFSSLSLALPGDFLKIWWNESIGAAEHGHSVIFMGSGSHDGLPTLSYWSSNVPGGFGIRTVPLSRIHRMLFSRFKNPDAISHADLLPHSDHYLYLLQTHSSTASEMAALCKIR